MLIYSGTKNDFMKDAENDLVNTLYDNIKEKMHHSTSISEFLLSKKWEI